MDEQTMNDEQGPVIFQVSHGRVRGGVNNRGGQTDRAACFWRDEWWRAEVTRGSVCAGVARQLVAAGAPDGPWMAVDAATGQRQFFGASLHGLARLTIVETDKGPRFVKYQPFKPGAWTA